jgi:hypothetical protein
LANLKRIPDSSLAIREAPKEPWRDADWQKLWLVLKARPWTSLAIVPAAAGGPPDFTLTIAVTLARIGILHLGTPIHVADATRIPLVHLEQFTDEVRRLNQDGDLVLLALPTIEENPVTVSLARSASAAVLCILMEEMSSTEAKRTVERIGTSHFVGSAVFYSGGAPGMKR